MVLVILGRGVGVSLGEHQMLVQSQVLRGLFPSPSPLVLAGCSILGSSAIDDLNVDLHSLG